MFRLIVLGSGSAGNAAVVSNDKVRILVDAGLGARTLKARLEQANIDPCTLSGILLTHEHGDHTSGLASLCKSHPLPIYCNALTAHTLRRSPPLAEYRHWRIFETGTAFDIAGVTVRSFSVPHDAVDPVGYLLDDGEDTLGILTDLGYATNPVIDCLRPARTLLIEMNHDEKLLQDDVRRPWPVKQRIMSRHGHLSNMAAAEIIRQLAAHSLRRVVAAHLSRDCNHPDIVHNTVRLTLEAAGLSDIVVDCACQETILIVE